MFAGSWEGHPVISLRCRLLEDIRKTAMLTGRDVRLAQGIPIINILPVVGM
jgi:tetrahydromethanopterin S-methyltransferase subunit F